MKKTLFSITILILFGSVLFMVGRTFRVSKTPHGSKFSCNTCHTNGGGSPLNSFGQAVNSRVTPGGSESFWSPELAALDSDRDGFTNGEELQDPSGLWKEGNANPGDANLVTNPGDISSIPTSLFDEGNVYTYQLNQNYPNPFNPSTTISYTLKEARDVKLNIYNSLGEKVATLVNNYKNAGTYEVQFSATNLNSGIYYYSIQAGDFIQTKKMTLIK